MWKAEEAWALRLSLEDCISLLQAASPTLGFFCVWPWTLGYWFLPLSLQPKSGSSFLLLLICGFPRHAPL